MKRIALLISLALMPTLAFAQGTPARIRGTIASLTDKTLTVTTREGTTVAVTLLDPLSVSVPKRLELTDIKAGDYVGIAAEPDKGPGGTATSLAVQVFPAAMRGTAEGSFGWDLTPTSTMTNGNVDAVANGVSGRVLTMSFKGQTAKLDVPAGTPIYTPIAATPADLKPGAAVFIYGVKAPDGKISTSRVLVGKDGINPPS
jgi:hypothetical protein